MQIFERQIPEGEKILWVKQYIFYHKKCSLE